MKKADLITAVLMHSEKALPRSNVEVVLSGLVKTAIAELRSKGEFTLPGFGRFVVKTRKARVGRNPRTGVQIEVPEKRGVLVRPVKTLREAL